MSVELRESKILPNNKDCLQFFFKINIIIITIFTIIILKIFRGQSLLFGEIFDFPDIRRISAGGISNFPALMRSSAGYLAGILWISGGYPPEGFLIFRTRMTKKEVRFLFLKLLPQSLSLSVLHTCSMVSDACKT